MYYIKARYYKPDIYRFISRDPVQGDLSDPMSLNLYAYCADNPVNMVDPDGNHARWFSHSHFTYWYRGIPIPMYVSYMIYKGYDYSRGRHVFDVYFGVEARRMQLYGWAATTALSIASLWLRTAAAAAVTVAITSIYSLTTIYPPTAYGYYNRRVRIRTNKRIPTGMNYA